MNKKIFTLSVFALAFFFLSSCVKDDPVGPTSSETPILPAQSYDYVKINQDLADFRLPETIPTPAGGFFDINCFNCESTFNANQVTSNEVATLGRVLFYDTNLSINKSISCASCHKQELAFADDVALSVGFGGKDTDRNSMSLANPILNKNFFWDSRVNNLEDLVIQPIENHIELGFADMNTLVSRIQDIEYYDELFMKAYGTTDVSQTKINDAIAQFVGSMFSGDAKFDAAKENDFAEYTEMEKIGMGLFFSERTKCNRCHAGANFNAPDQPGGEYGAPGVAGTANVGLDVVYEDQGKGNGKFKIPSLRNIQLTAPYMHDGRFETIREVLNHYDQGIVEHNFLDDNLREGDAPKKMNFSELEFQALEAFLNTLTDKDLVTNEKYSNPFRN